MKPTTRRTSRTEDKIWETKLRHSLYVSYLQDPDLQILTFLAGAEMGNLMRVALRDYIAKHNLPIADPAFQNRVFMAASMRLASGQAPTSQQINDELGIDLFAHLRTAPTQAPSATPTATVGNTVATHAINTEPTAHHKLPAPPPAPSPATAPSPTILPAQVSPAPNTPKPPPAFDFGPGADMVNGMQAIDLPAEPAKISARERWLARHQ